jgi:cobalt-precorrin-7 (C5)-methyltransferase
MIRVIGMGPGDTKYLTQDAIDKIKNSKKVIAFGRISKTAEKIADKVIKVSRVEEMLKHLEDGEDIAVLASGDPCFYGILEFLKNKKIEVDEVVPGLSSIQYMMSKLKKSWHNAQLVSLHGRDDGIEKIMKSRLAVVLTDSKNTPSSLSKALYNKGIRGKIYAGFNLSYEDEKIVVKNVGDEIENISSLSVVVIENEMD